MQETEDDCRIRCVAVHGANDTSDQVGFDIGYGVVGDREPERVEHGQVDACQQDDDEQENGDRAGVIERIETRVVDQPVDGCFEA